MNEIEAVKRSYYAIIPANVRYDKELTPNAKLLYGEITALCNERGYCWAGNSYFADLYSVSKVSISKWISQLVQKGYISSHIEYKIYNTSLMLLVVFLHYQDLILLPDRDILLPFHF